MEQSVHFIKGPKGLCVKVEARFTPQEVAAVNRLLPHAEWASFDTLKESRDDDTLDRCLAVLRELVYYADISSAESDGKKSAIAQALAERRRTDASRNRREERKKVRARRRLLKRDDR